MAMQVRCNSVGIKNSNVSAFLSVAYFYYHRCSLRRHHDRCETSTCCHFFKTGGFEENGDTMTIIRVNEGGPLWGLEDH